MYPPANAPRLGPVTSETSQPDEHDDHSGPDRNVDYDAWRRGDVYIGEYLARGERVILTREGCDGEDPPQTPTRAAQ